MSLAKPKLDDRTFQQLVDEAKKRIPHYTKEWTDHNVSDPGVTLIELFAWMTETMLYRLNQVPDLHLIRMMEMLGIRLQEPISAELPVTFWLSAPQAQPVVLPGGTEVASTQTETAQSIIFTTNEDRLIAPPQLKGLLSRVAGGAPGTKRYKEHRWRENSADFGPNGEGIFSADGSPQPDDALYFGFDNDLSEHILGFEFDCNPAGGANVNPNLPPYVWEASTGEGQERWAVCDVDMDTTRALNGTGRIRIHLPKLGRYAVNQETLYWVRVRLRGLTDEDKTMGMSSYTKTPLVRKLSVASWGITANATHAELVKHEFIGRSDGSPNQQFRLQRTPILARSSDEQLIVHPDGEDRQFWQEVNDFGNSGFNDRHYTLDSLSGVLRFGPAVRQPDGTIKLYGAIPPRGANLFLQQYRTGGGTVGNVRAHVLNTLKTAIPFIAKVDNREPAFGGLDGESVEAAMMRMPQLLRTRERAVTEDDFEFLAMQGLPSHISRVKCIQPRPMDLGGKAKAGEVYVLVIPRIFEAERLLTAEELAPSADLIGRLTDYLDQRRLLTVKMSVQSPNYRGVAVRVQLRPTPESNRVQLEQAILARLHRYLNPLTGGNEGKGWPFGRDLFISDVYQCLQGLPNIQFIRNVEMQASPVAGSGDGKAVEALDVVEHGVIASGLHRVEFV